MTLKDRMKINLSVFNPKPTRVAEATMYTMGKLWRKHDSAQLVAETPPDHLESEMACVVQNPRVGEGRVEQGVCVTKSREECVHSHTASQDSQQSTTSSEAAPRESSYVGVYTHQQEEEEDGVSVDSLRPPHTRGTTTQSPSQPTSPHPGAMLNLHNLSLVDGQTCHGGLIQHSTPLVPFDPRVKALCGKCGGVAPTGSPHCVLSPVAEWTDSMDNDQCGIRQAEC